MVFAQPVSNFEYTYIAERLVNDVLPDLLVVG